MSVSSNTIRRHPMRAFLLTPVFASVVYIVSSFDSRFVHSLEDAAEAAMITMAVVPLASIVIGLIMVVSGLPIYLILRWWRFEYAVATILLAGAIAGVFYVLGAINMGSSSSGYYAHGCQIIDAGVRTSCGWQIFWLEVVHFSMVGFVSGAVFWRLYAGAWVWKL